MNIKTRLSFQFTLIIVGILLVFSSLVYYFSYSSQLDKFRDNLFNRARNTAILLLRVSEVDSTLLTKIQESTFYWEKEEIVVTDSAHHIIYRFNVKYLTDKIIGKYINEGGMGHFKIGKRDGVFNEYTFKKQTVHVFVMAFDHARAEHLKELRGILVWSNLFSIWIAILFSYLFARNAIKPISEIIKQVKKIDYSKLNTRLEEGNKCDEIAQLAITFNEMLTDLELAFKNQAEFISHASHELRTPLSIIISESDYILAREQEGEDYMRHISGITEDLKKLNSQLNTLLELAQINKIRAIQVAEIRIDEVIFSATQIIKLKYPDRKIILRVDYPDNENELPVEGNYGMLVIAFSNLIDNACKFSGEDVTVNIAGDNQSILVTIVDKGIGIPQDELTRIFLPFNRASNATFISGYGIGLSLAVKIFDLHHATINVISKINDGTRFELRFNGVNSGI